MQGGRDCLKVWSYIVFRAVNGNHVHLVPKQIPFVAPLCSARAAMPGRTFVKATLVMPKRLGSNCGSRITRSVADGFPHTADCPTLSVDHLLVTSAASLVIGRVGLDQSMLRGQEGADKSRAGRSPASARHVVGPLLSFGIQPLYLNNHWQRIHRQKHSAFRRERANSQESCPSARGGRRLVRSSQGLTGGEPNFKGLAQDTVCSRGRSVPTRWGCGWFGPCTGVFGDVRSTRSLPSPRSRRGCWAPSFSMFGRV